MKLQLVSFKTCPYVQRSVITLNHKGQEFDIKYIDLANPPAWFTEKSPLGKVPIVEVTQDDGTQTVLFESAVINEFVDEITGGGLLPSDPVQKARARGWIEFASECNMSYYMAAVAKDEAAYEQHKAALMDKLARVEQQLEGPFFLGAFSLVDTAYAPVLQRIARWAETDPGFDVAHLSKLAAWRDALLAMPEVQNSIVEEWPQLEADYVRSTGSHLAKLAA